jgi:Ca2+/H+ antiporter, TMEM165/GDT1 family
MEALLPVFIAVLLAEVGGRVQAIGNVLSLAYPQSQNILFGALGVSTLISLSIGAIGGAFIAGMIAYDARTLLFGLALVFAGLPMVIAVKRPSVKGFATPIGAGLFGFGRAQFGDASQFIVFAVAARTGEPLLAILGGMLGVIVAAAPAIILQGAWPRKIPLRPIRIAAALILTLSGAVATITALQLS